MANTAPSKITGVTMRLGSHNYLHLRSWQFFSAIVQARVQEFVRGGAQNLKAFFFFFFFFFFAFQLFRGGPAQKLAAEKMTFSTIKVAKYNICSDDLFFFCFFLFFFVFQFLGGGAQAPWAPPPWTRACCVLAISKLSAGVTLSFLW